MSRSDRSALAERLRRMTLTAIFVASPAGATYGARDVPTYGAIEGGPSVLLTNADGSNPYASVVRYQGSVPCTGVFIATVPDNEDPGDAPAYVLTNGHCVDLSGANDVLLDRPSAQNHRVIFNYFADAPAQAVAFPIKRTAYATMKGQDIAVVELAARFDDVVRQGFEPWRATLTLPARDEPVVVVGAPSLGGVQASFLRLAACRIEARVPVVLEFNWHWFDFDRNGCADIRPGSSGSAVLSRLTGRLLGLVNTTTIGAVRYTECFLNHPCEPAPGGVTARARTTYMTPIVRMDRCFDESGWFDMQQHGCPLDQGVQVRLTPPVLGAENPGLDVGPLGQPRRHWSVAVSGPLELYRFKVVPAATGDCRDLRGYSAPIRVTDQPMIEDPLPTREGYYFLCVVGGTRATQGFGWQSLDHPTVAAVRIDTTPPEPPALVTIDETDIAWRVSFGMLPPEISLHTYKFGRPSETRCEDPAGYRVVLIPFLTLPKAGRPYVFCAIPYDAAGNRGRVFEALLP